MNTIRSAAQRSTTRSRTLVCAVALLGVAAFDLASADAAKAKKRKADAAATTRPASDGESAASTTPTALVGKWMYGSVSPTTYWNSDTGAFVGNARGSAGIYEFDGAGRYKEYIYLELRTGGLTSKAWTVHEGTVTFTDGSFALHVERGHYQFWTNEKLTTDRDMKPDECAKLSKTYHWMMTKDDAGRLVFTVPFDDGSKMVYRRQADE